MTDGSGGGGLANYRTWMPEAVLVVMDLSNGAGGAGGGLSMMLDLVVINRTTFLLVAAEVSNCWIDSIWKEEGGGGGGVHHLVDGVCGAAGVPPGSGGNGTGGADYPCGDASDNPVTPANGQG